MATDVALLRLLQLVSPGLPIGMYSYSQGMESAVADGWISNSEDCKDWLNGLMRTALCHTDLPILARLYNAWQVNDETEILTWSRTLLAYRETAELRLEDRQCGQALARLLVPLGFEDMQNWIRHKDSTLALSFSFAAVHWRISLEQTLTGYLWSWLENQVLCAIKLVPLGQVAGQRLLIELADTIPLRIEQALQLDETELGGSAFSLALASSRHEMQYSRLFRS
jgi:urease accessory protein